MITSLSSLVSVALLVIVSDLRAEFSVVKAHSETVTAETMSLVSPGPEKKTYTWLDADGSIQSVTTYRQRGESRAAFCRRHERAVAEDLAKYGHSGGFLKNLKITAYFANHNPAALAILEDSKYWSP